LRARSLSVEPAPRILQNKPKYALPLTPEDSSGTLPPLPGHSKKRTHCERPARENKAIAARRPGIFGRSQSRKPRPNEPNPSPTGSSVQSSSRAALAGSPKTTTYREFRTAATVCERFCKTKPIAGPRTERSQRAEVYLVSRCGWCFRQYGQNFFISRRSVVVFLFFVFV